MKNKSILLIVSLFTIVQSFAIRIDGTVLLRETNDHSGIKAVFKAISPSANTDSAFTNSFGEYSLSLSSGIYEISISKSGYSSLNDGQLLLSSDTVLAHDSLIYLGHRVYLGTNVAGTLYKDTSYVILANTWLGAGKSLYIEPGTHIGFAEGARFDVSGTLIAQGTKEDKIYFELLSEETGYWNSINVYTLTKDVAFNNCHFENGSRPVKIYSAGNFEVENCFFKNSEWTGIFVDGTNSVKSGHVHHNDFSGGHSNAYFGYCDSTLIIEHNTIRNFGSSALAVGTTAIVRYNKIFRNKQALSGSPKEIHHNDIYYNLTGIGTAVDNGSNIYNNTFYDNGTAMVIWESANAGVIAMNCFSNNKVAFKFVEENVKANINYNFFETNAVIEGPGTLGYGIGIDTNQNGDAIDTYLNVIGEDAGFFTSDTANPHAFYPYTNSILIDAGDPSFKDDDGSIRDIGAHHYVKWVSVKDPIELKSGLHIYPNPFHDFTIFEFDQEFNDSFILQIFDISGNVVFVEEGMRGPQYRLTNQLLERGIYFYQVIGSQQSYNGKLIVE